MNYIPLYLIVVKMVIIL